MGLCVEVEPLSLDQSALGGPSPFLRLQSHVLPHLHKWRGWRVHCGFTRAHKGKLCVNVTAARCAAILVSYLYPCVLHW